MRVIAYENSGNVKLGMLTIFYNLQKIFVLGKILIANAFHCPYKVLSLQSQTASLAFCSDVVSFKEELG